MMDKVYTGVVMILGVALLLFISKLVFHLICRIKKARHIYQSSSTKTSPLISRNPGFALASIMGKVDKSQVNQVR